MTPLRLLGLLLLLAGLVLAADPTLVYDPGPAADTFAAIERRIPWGAVAGLGTLLVARTRLRPWGVTIASLILWGTAGLLAARSLGLALDGADSPRQWMWFAVEVVIAVGAIVYLRRAQGQRGASRTFTTG